MTIIKKLLNLSYEVYEVTSLNIYFVLLYIFLGLLQEGKERRKLAHTSYLISYYLYTVITPPNCENLALYYGQKAVESDNRKLFSDRLVFLKKDMNKFS